MCVWFGPFPSAEELTSIVLGHYTTFIVIVIGVALLNYHLPLPICLLAQSCHGLDARVSLPPFPPCVSAALL